MFFFVSRGGRGLCLGGRVLGCIYFSSIGICFLYFRVVGMCLGVDL